MPIFHEELIERLYPEHPKYIYDYKTRTYKQVPFEEWWEREEFYEEFPMIGPPETPYKITPEEALTLDELVTGLYPGQEGLTFEALAGWAFEEPTRFLETVVPKGKTEETETLLVALGLGKTDIEDIFAPPVEFEIPEEGYPVELQTQAGELMAGLIKPDLTVWVGEEQIGRFSPETGAIEPVGLAWWEKILGAPSTQAVLGAIETGLQYVEGWWQTGLMEMGFGFYKTLEFFAGEKTPWYSQAEQIMDKAYQEYGWKAVFSKDVGEAWDIYFPERDSPWWLGLISELCNPIWWVSIGGIAAKFAKPLTKVPVLGSTSQKIAKGIQVAEAAPGKLAVKAVKEVAIKPTRHLLEKLPSRAELSGFLFKNDLFRNISQRTIAKVPWVKEWAPGTWLPSKLPEKLATKAEIEMAVGEEVLLRTSILEMGQSVKGQALASLRDLGTTKGLLGTKNAMCNPKLVKPRFEGESLALGDVVQAPERYIFKKKNALEYCKRAQELCSHMYELATVQEGITIHKVALEPFEEYVHWVCTGVKNIHGDIQMLRRGTRAVGGIVPSMKPRRFENMVDGIRAGYKYGDDLEIYVGSYVQDMFKTIADTRFGEALANVVARVEGMLPTKPLERLAALFPERVLRFDAVKREMGDLGYAWSGVKRMYRGEKLPPATMSALERRTPELTKQIQAAIDDPKALRKLSKQLKNQINELRPQWWKAKYARAEAMEIVKKPMPKYEEGYIRTATGYAHPLFQGQIYPRSIADMATKMLNDEAAAWLRVSSQISQTIRLQVAALDVSAGMIQGFVAHGAHPIAAIRGQIGAIKAMVSPRTFAHFCQQHADTIAEMTYYAGGPKSFEYFEGLGVLQRYLGKLPPAKWALGQTYGRMEAAFSAWGTITRVNMWEAAAKHWIKRGQGFEYARYLQRLTGIMSFQQLGMPASRRAFLSAFVSFAPQYRFSILSYMADVFKGGMTGNAVRADLAKLVAAGTTAYVAFCIATDNPIYLNPLKDGKKFMSINVDDHWVGMGGGVVSTLRAFADITASTLSIGMDEPMDFLTIDKWQNPLIRAIFMQSSPLTGIISELVARRDFLGYPMESPEDWLLWAGEQLTPIWLQDILFDKSGVPYSPLAILGEFVGLRTSPQTRWETLDDRIRAVKAWESVSDLTDEQRQRIEKGESILSVLDRFQKAELFSAFPELEPYYEEAIVDALTRDSQTRKNYEASMTNIRDELIDSLTKGLEVGVKLDGEDTRWLRGRYSDVMSVYGAKNDIIRESPEYQDMFAEWEESRDKREPDAELFDLAYWDYIENVVAPDYETLAGDFDWEAYEGALKAWKDHWGEDFYQKVLYVLENNKADFPEWAVKLWKDKIALNESGYWKIDPEIEGGPEERMQLRLNNPEIDAMLALWGYGGKLQTWDAYNFAVQWAKELGIPLEQLGMGLPPHTLMRNYFDLNEIVKQTSGSSIEAKLYKLEHPEYLAWGLEQEIWSDDLSGENINELRLRVQHKDSFELYDSYGDWESENYIDDEADRRAKRQEMLERNTEFQKARYAVDGYNLGLDAVDIRGITMNLLDEYVEYRLQPTSGDWRERFRLAHGNLDSVLTNPEIMGNDVIKPIKEEDVMPLQYDALYEKHKDEFELYESYGDWQSPNYIEDSDKRSEKREAMLAEDKSFANAKIIRAGYEKGVPPEWIKTYADLYELPDAGYDRERLLQEDKGFYKDVWLGILGNQPIEFDRIPSVELEKLINRYDSYGDKTSPSYKVDNSLRAQLRLRLRCTNRDLDEWFVLVRDLKPAYGTDRCVKSEDGEIAEGEDEPKERAKTYLEQLEEQGLLEEWEKQLG